MSDNLTIEQEKQEQEYSDNDKKVVHLNRINSKKIDMRNPMRMIDIVNSQEDAELCIKPFYFGLLPSKGFSFNPDFGTHRDLVIARFPSDKQEEYVFARSTMDIYEHLNNEECNYIANDGSIHVILREKCLCEVFFIQSHELIVMEQLPNFHISKLLLLFALKLKGRINGEVDLTHLLQVLLEHTPDSVKDIRIMETYSEESTSDLKLSIPDILQTGLYIQNREIMFTQNKTSLISESLERLEHVVYEERFQFINMQYQTSLWIGSDFILCDLTRFIPCRVQNRTKTHIADPFISLYVYLHIILFDSRFKTNFAIPQIASYINSWKKNKGPISTQFPLEQEPYLIDKRNP